MADNILSANPKDKSFVRNTEQIDINLVEWINYDETLCSQCGQNHGYALTAGSTIQHMISFLDRETSKEK